MDTIIKKDFIFLLTSPEARYLVVPIITLLLANLAKFFCQKDSAISRESFYWGPNIVMSAILILFVDFSNRILYETNKTAFSIQYAEFANAFISVTCALNDRKVTVKILKRSEKMMI